VPEDRPLEIDQPDLPEIEQQTIPEFDRSTEHPSENIARIKSEQNRYTNGTILL
jgi:hypothetical protein